MTAVLIVVAAVAIGVAAFFMNQLATVRGGQQKLAAELEAQRQKASAAESEARKAAEQLESKRRELEEAKEKLKGTKKKRFEEAEAAKQGRDIERVRLEVERAMEEKLAQAREEADTAKAQAKRLAAELDAAKSRRAAAAPAPELTATAVVPVPSQQPTVERVIRELSPEEKARLEAAEKTARQLKGKVDELEAELRKARGRTETDRRVLIVQKGEIDTAKDKFRSLETKHNALLLERDELRKAMWELEKELQAATGKAPTSQPAGETASDGVPPSPAASTEGDAAKA